MKPETTAEAKAAHQTGELAKSLEPLSHMQLFELTLALFEIKTKMDVTERTSDLCETLVRLIGTWVCKPEKKK